MIAWGPAVGLALLFCALGCVQARPNDSGVSRQDALEVSRLHTQKCGRCHAPPQPRTRTRDHLEAAFLRHKTRVRFTAEQWAAMIDYLAVASAPDESNTR
ncbi:MAG: hypothetical protein M3O36_12480 [Myxococcota bacterium]|nr:hypothetical protein [Myxococcota bacterium]